MPSLQVQTPGDLTPWPARPLPASPGGHIFYQRSIRHNGSLCPRGYEVCLGSRVVIPDRPRFPIITRQKIYAAFRLHKDSKSVAQILPFAEEFSCLYDESISGQRDEGSSGSVWRHYRAKGYLKYAQAASSRRDGALALGKVLIIQPGYLLERDITLFG